MTYLLAGADCSDCGGGGLGLSIVLGFMLLLGVSGLIRGAYYQLTGAEECWKCGKRLPHPSEVCPSIAKRAAKRARWAEEAKVHNERVKREAREALFEGTSTHSSDNRPSQEDP